MSAANGGGTLDTLSHSTGRRVGERSVVGAFRPVISGERSVVGATRPVISGERSVVEALWGRSEQ